jgi:hypothetical protein
VPGVNPPVNEQFFSQLGQLFQRVRALETQQQSAITNLQGQVVVFTGLQPGSVPAKYGIGVYDPVSGDSMFFGESVAGVQFDSGNYVPGVSGFNITPDGNAEFNQLTLRNGIVGDAALANPVEPRVIYNSVSGQNGSGSYVALGTVTVTVPTGFTRALVTVAAVAGASCGGGGGTYLETYAAIAGDSSPAESIWIPAGVGSSMAVPFADLLTGVSGTFTVTCYALQSSPANVTAGTVGGSIAGSILFLR